MAKILVNSRTASYDYIQANSAAIAKNDFVSLSGGFLIKAIATGEILGVAKETLTAASDNQTVAKKKNTVIIKDKEMLFELTSNAASLANADVGSYFNLEVTTQKVDYSTKGTTELYVNTSDAGAAVDAVVKRQLVLVEVLSTTIGKFKLV